MYDVADLQLSANSGPHGSQLSSSAEGQCLLVGSAFFEIRHQRAEPRDRRSQVMVSRRTTRSAENSEAMTPRLKVTAKPLTGPAPNQYIKPPPPELFSGTADLPRVGL